MMNYVSIFVMSFSIALLGALAPGPLLTAVIAKSPVYGFKTGPMLMVGHAIAEIGMVVLLVSGLAYFVQNPSAINIIAFAGGFILIYFGLDMLRNLPEGLPGKDSVKGKGSLPFLGITISLSNPYWAVWWLTIGFGLVLAAQKAGIVALAVFFVGHILADIAWYSMVSFTVSRGKRFISNRVYREVIRICGIILTVFGFYFMVLLFTGGFSSFYAG